MSDQLVGWLAVVIAVPGSVVAIIQLSGGMQRRRRRRTLRLSCWKVWGIERMRLDVTDDRQP